MQGTTAAVSSSWDSHARWRGQQFIALSHSLVLTFLQARSLKEYESVNIWEILGGSMWWYELGSGVDFML